MAAALISGSPEAPACPLQPDVSAEAALAGFAVAPAEGLFALAAGLSFAEVAALNASRKAIAVAVPKMSFALRITTPCDAMRFQICGFRRLHFQAINVPDIHILHRIESPRQAHW
jgi:hypothetical protein